MSPLAPGIRAVVFDAVGTLIHPEPGPAVVYHQVGHRFGSRLTEVEIRARFGAAFRREEEQDRQTGWRTSEQRERRRWQDIVAAVLDDVTEPEACFAALFDHFGRPDAWRCTEETADVVAALARRGYILGMASNYDTRLRGVAAGLGELKRLEHIIISSEVGCRKPAPEFFAALCNRIEVPAGRVLYVGDDPGNDYRGAQAAGLRAVLFDPAGRAAADMVSIRKLSELL